MAANVGKLNIGVGLMVMSAFMIYGFVLIYQRDFSPDRAAWLASSLDGPHFEAKLAHVHGNLFSLLNIVFGFVLLKLPIRSRGAHWISWLALGGLLMPLGILAGTLFRSATLFRDRRGTSIFLATLWLGIEVMRSHPADQPIR
ncbi:MAG: hypothetical protein IPK19_26800 [Chloroflexi bacterium]|nr:hypothetical protein [Chloroflexota bacterium]